MKKTILFLATVFISGIAIAQANVSSAKLAYNKGDLVSAATFIEKALSNEKATAKEKTWRYRGDIYLAIALDSTLYTSKYPNALIIAKDSYIKAKEIDKKKSYTDEDNAGLDKVQKLAANHGYLNYVAGAYDKAGDSYALAADLIKLFGQTDTISLYNAAISYEKAGMNEKALDYYKQCADLGHKVPEIFLFIASLQKKMGDEEAAFQTIKDARQKYPNSKELIIEELNVYLASGRDEEAKENLIEAIKLDPENKILHFSLGTIYDKLGQFDEAEKAYNKAIKIDPNYVDALYNLGALHYNKGVEVVKMANDLPPSESTKYQELVKNSEKNFADSMPFLERAYELTPDDVQIMETLKNVYARIGEDEKYEAIKAKLDGK